MDIIKALDMKQGHWFKCPNGHPYIITECGGAMQTANCYECGAPIGQCADLFVVLLREIFYEKFRLCCCSGGGNHSLLASNQFAPEMDGAVRPAWDSVLVPQNFGL